MVVMVATDRSFTELSTSSEFHSFFLCNSFSVGKLFVGQGKEFVNKTNMPGKVNQNLLGKIYELQNLPSSYPI